MTDQALTKSETARTPDIITTRDEYHGAMKRWEQEHYNILTPFTNFSGLAPSHGILTTIVQVNGDKSAGEVYDGLPFLKSHEVSIAKIGLRKLAEAAGISTRTERMDDRKIPNYWEFKATATYRGADGSIVTREATKEWDLRDGSPQMRGWKDAQIEESRKHGLRNCEARAINAAIRECGFGVKQKYTRQELARPFVVCRVMFQPDMSDPDIKRMVTQAALGGTTALYGQLPPAKTIDVEETLAGDDAPRQVGHGSTASIKNGGHPDPDPDTPPCEGAVRIARVEERSGGTSGRKRFAIIDSSGVEHLTSNLEIAKSAERLAASRAWVDILVEVEGQYRELVDIAPVTAEATSTSSLPDPGRL